MSDTSNVVRLQSREAVVCDAVGVETACRRVLTQVLPNEAAEATIADSLCNAVLLSAAYLYDESAYGAPSVHRAIKWAVGRFRRGEMIR